MNAEAEELFDVVDEHDQVVRQERRSVVHAQKLTHRAVHVFLFRSDGHLLIHKRTDHKEEFPGVWTSSASGHVSAGEAYDETAPRELEEELGVVSPLQRLHKFAASPDTCMEHTVLYRTECDDPINFDPHEIAAIEYVSTDEIAARIKNQPAVFSPAFRLLFGWYMSRESAD